MTSLPTESCQVFLLDKMTVNEAITENADGSYTVFINNDLCEAKRLAAIAHAFDHIKKEDFGKTDVQKVESEAHAKRRIEP